MSSFAQRLMGAIRAARYKAYRAGKPAGWAYGLDKASLEREVDRWYWSVRGEHVDFEHPRTFSEKMQWLKVHDDDPRKTTLSDKLAVRPTVASVAGEGALPEVYRIWDDPSTIDFSGLDKPFFLKCNNGSGMMMRVDDPAAANLDEVRAKAAGWIADDFPSRYFELHYADITPRIYAEELLDDIEWEYQAWCFSGTCEFISAIREPHGVNEKQTYSTTWERLPFVTSPPEYQGAIPRPDCLEQIVDWSERLSDDFAFVRVDWYGTRHGLLFSEMSFTPAYGIVRWVPSEYNMRVGELIHLPIED